MELPQCHNIVWVMFYIHTYKHTHTHTKHQQARHEVKQLLTHEDYKRAMKRNKK